MDIIKILIVDDEEAIRSLLKLWLKGYVVLEAGDVASAKQIIQEHSPDLVITDLGLPNARGEKLVRWIQSEYNSLRSRAVKIIALSGDNPELVRPVVMAAGADYFVTKPFDPAVLKEVIKGF